MSRCSRWVFAVCAYGLSMTGLTAAELDAERQQELQHLLKHDCGSCHGMRLTGGLGPALTSDVLVNKPDEFLRQAILNGRRDTPMPPFSALLTEEDVNWLVRLLRIGERK